MSICTCNFRLWWERERKRFHNNFTSRIICERRKKRKIFPSSANYYHIQMARCMQSVCLSSTLIAQIVHRDIRKILKNCYAARWRQSTHLCYNTALALCRIFKWQKPVITLTDYLHMFSRLTALFYFWSIRDYRIWTSSALSFRFFSWIFIFFLKITKSFMLI